MIDPARRVLGCGLLVGLIPLAFGLMPGDEAARLERLIVGYGLASIPYLYIWWRWTDLPDTRRTLGAVVGLAALTRLALLLLPPLLSEDLWRYLWDGAMHWQGVDPYLHPPNAAALDGLAADPTLSAIRARIGHAHIPTIYPPAAQLTFAAAGAFGPSALLLRLALVGADLLVVLGLWRWAAASGRRPALAALYAFAPLPVLESAVGGHIDAVGAAGIVLAGAALAAAPTLRRTLGAGIGLAVGIWTKLVPVLALPVLLRHRPRAAAATVGAAGLMLLPYLLTSGGHMLTGLRAYGQRWRANDGLFAVLLWPFEQVWPASNQPLDLPEWAVWAVHRLVGASGAPGEVWPDELAFAAAKLVAGGLFGLVCLWCWWKARTLDDALGPMMTALFLVSPVVHPWYLMWLLPLAALKRGGGPGDARAPWSTAVLVWGLTAWVAYLPRPEYLRSGQWHDSVLWRWVEYAPVWAALIWGLWRVWRGARDQKMKPTPIRGA